jgi:hypothetical protein
MWEWTPGARSRLHVGGFSVWGSLESILAMAGRDRESAVALPTRRRRRRTGVVVAGGRAGTDRRATSRREAGGATFRAPASRAIPTKRGAQITTRAIPAFQSPIRELNTSADRFAGDNESHTVQVCDDGAWCGCLKGYEYRVQREGEPARHAGSLSVYHPTHCGEVPMAGHH